MFSRTTAQVTFFAQCKTKRLNVFYWSIKYLSANIALNMIILFLQKYEVFFSFVCCFTVYKHHSI